MIELLWLVPAIPILSFTILAMGGRVLSRPAASVLGAGSVGLSALITILIAIEYISSLPDTASYTVTLWTWFNVGGFDPGISFYLDAMTVVFMFVITFVGLLIHIYSIEFMYEEEGFSRFFAYMNLFVGAMLILVMADNLLLLYLGWEGVGLCSFLLIGFWYKDPENGAAARKAFIVTRVGDTAMAIGLFLLVMTFNTLNIQALMGLAVNQWTPGHTTAVAVGFLLLGGALGKSAQLPLHTWLPDAMAGPSPVSALIHAATMVTAGVYLIARTYDIFLLAPVVQYTVAIIGAVTLIVSGISALSQYDIKRVLAYSTISQIGYMFLALGVGALSAAVFHFMIHAFFKALLFLSAGAVIIALHHEHNMFKMGGIRKKLPVIYWTFLAGAVSLAALPFISAGFYSKDMILFYAWSSEYGNKWLYAIGLLGAFITAVYTFRMVFVTFFGEQKTHIEHYPKTLIKIPLIVLAVLSITGGFIQLPHNIAHFTLFSDFVNNSLETVALTETAYESEFFLQVMAAVTAILGIFVAYWFWLKKPGSADVYEKSRLSNFFYTGWRFDWVYDHIFVKPVVWLAAINKRDFIDRIYDGIAFITGILHHTISLSQTGRLRWYAMSIALGAIIILTLVIFI
jgi:NADH-quinone oxidoreductase subunit L